MYGVLPVKCGEGGGNPLPAMVSVYVLQSGGDSGEFYLSGGFVRIIIRIILKRRLAERIYSRRIMLSAGSHKRFFNK